MVFTGRSRYNDAADVRADAARRRAPGRLAGAALAGPLAHTRGQAAQIHTEIDRDNPASIDTNDRYLCISSRIVCTIKVSDGVTTLE